MCYLWCLFCIKWLISSDCLNEVKMSNPSVPMCDSGVSWRWKSGMCQMGVMFYRVLEQSRWSLSFQRAARAGEITVFQAAAVFQWMVCQREKLARLFHFCSWHVITADAFDKYWIKKPGDSSLPDLFWVNNEFDFFFPVKTWDWRVCWNRLWLWWAALREDSHFHDWYVSY